MSWIIGQYLRELPYIKEKGDIESDTYNNAILIEKAINDMDEKGLLTDFEKDVIIAIVQGFNFSEISRLLSTDRQRVSNTFTAVTDRIAYILGGEFTDTAFLEQLDADDFMEQNIEELFKRKLPRMT